MRREFLLILGVFTSLLYATALKAVDLTIVTPKGHVTFSVVDDWTVIGSQTMMPVAVMAFQVKDPADEGTSESTNVAVSLYDQNTPEGREAITGIGKAFGAAKPKSSRIGDWQVFDQLAMQGEVQYSILDARRQVADVTVSVRLAWPHLTAHPKSYDRGMRELFKTLLASFHGALGPYQPKPGEVIRRPDPRGLE